MDVFELADDADELLTNNLTPRGGVPGGSKTTTKFNFDEIDGDATTRTEPTSGNTDGFGAAAA